MTRFLSALALALLLIAITAPVVAQEIKPLEIEPDANGVDLLSGKVTPQNPELSVPASSKLSLGRLMDLQPLLSGTVSATGGAAYAQASFSINNSGLTSDAVKCWEAECVSTRGNGSSMIASYASSTYNYVQGKTGLRITFNSPYHTYTPPGINSPTQMSVYPSQMRWPNGETLTFTYDKVIFSCAANSCTAHRPTKIASNLGYEIQITYQSATLGDVAWNSIDKAGIYKTGQSTPLQEQTYSGNTMTDIGNRTWTGVTNNLGNANQRSDYEVTLPNETSPTLKAEQGQLCQNGFCNVGGVTDKVTNDGAVYDYSYTPSSQYQPSTFQPDVMFEHVKIDGPLGYQRDVYFYLPDPAATPTVPDPKRITKITNALGQDTLYEYGGAYNRLTKAIMPEGNAVEVVYDDAGNIVERRSKAKPGSGLADIVEKADYPDFGYVPVSGVPAPVHCMDMSCYQPEWTEDAKGNRTDYTWDINHGGLLTALAPADANGVRSKTINEYTAAGGITRLTKTRTCSETSGGANLTCGTADEVVKEISYWNDTFLPLTETATNGTGSISAVTSYTYDDAGRVLSVDGPLPGNGDTTYFRYDILGRKTWDITPKGANNKHIATRTTYRDADDQVTKVEKGTLTSPTDTNLVVLDTVETEYNDRRLAVKTTAKGSDNAIVSLTQASYDARNQPLCSAQRMNPLLFANPPADACMHGTAGAQGNDRIAKTIYDVLGRPVQMRRAVGKPLEQAEVTYGYTTNGQKQFVIDANGNKAQMVFDGHDRQTRWSFPSKTMPSAYNDATQATALSTSASVSTNDYEQYTYDANGNRTSLRKRDGLVINYTYDNVNRMTVKTIPAKPGVAAIHTRDVFYDYDFRGLQTRARFDSLNGPGVDNEYDVLGRMTKSTNRMFSTPLELSYLYDKAGRRTRVTHDDGKYFRYYYYKVGPAAKIREMTMAG